jgi:acyl-CoA thioester hydrolase
MSRWRDCLKKDAAASTARSTCIVAIAASAVSINYLAEAHHPNDVIIASGIGHVGTRSWMIASAAFQNGQCVATCDTTLVYTNADGPTAFPESFVAKFAAMTIKQP